MEVYPCIILYVIRGRAGVQKSAGVSRSAAVQSAALMRAAELNAAKAELDKAQRLVTQIRGGSMSVAVDVPSDLSELTATNAAQGARNLSNLNQSLS